MWTQSEARNALQIMERWTKCHMVIIGDVMLDHYVYGAVDRISPEAPVPVILKESERCDAGGAANAASNLKSLGASVSVIGAVGMDTEADVLRDLLFQKDISTCGVISVPGVDTIIKTRFFGNGQHVLRVDRERPIVHANGDIIDQIIAQVEEADLVVVSDYAKGTISEDLAATICHECAKHHKMLVVDTKPSNMSLFVGAKVVTPNAKEALAYADAQDDTDETLKRASVSISTDLSGTDVVVTRSSKGMLVYDASQNVFTPLPARVIEVYDVSGAGDTVLAAVALSLAAGADIVESARIANVAAEIAVTRRGTTNVEYDDLHKKITEEI